MRDTVVATVVLLGLAVLAACGGEPRGIEIAYGTDVCEYCGMTIDDSTLAAAFEDAKGHVHRFDEPGCMASWLRQRSESGGTARVRAADRGGWLTAQQAYFARGQRTPMAFGFVAHASRDAAFAATRPAGAEPATWLSILSEELKPNAPAR